MQIYKKRNETLGDCNDLARGTCICTFVNAAVGNGILVRVSQKGVH